MWLPILTSLNLDDKETAQLSTERPGMSDPFVRWGADGRMMKVCGKSEGLMWNYTVRASSNFKTYAAELRVPCKFYKKYRVSRLLFKNRKHTVDAGKMWPDCNGRLSYFNLKAVFTFSVTYFDLWWIANQVFLLHVLNLPNTSKPHLLWRLRLTSKQSLGTGLPLTTCITNGVYIKGLLQSTTSNA